jgi:hypothetical protein
MTFFAPVLHLVVEDGEGGRVELDDVGAPCPNPKATLPARA